MTRTETRRRGGGQDPGSAFNVSRARGSSQCRDQTEAAPRAAHPSNEVDMPTYPPSRPCRRQRAAWPRIIILVIILVFVTVMTALGYTPEAAAGVAAAALAAASTATVEPRDELSGELPGSHA
jgi:hypothetical protein